MKYLINFILLLKEVLINILSQNQEIKKSISIVKVYKQMKYNFLDKFQLIQLLKQFQNA